MWIRRPGPLSAVILIVGLATGWTTEATAKDGQKLGYAYERFAAEHQFVFDFIQELNVKSIELNREYCGFIYHDAAGQIRATPPVKGGTHSCMPRRPEGQARVFSSYHTHAAFDPASLNEYPSDQDMQGDFANRQNGYIATPGGRLWFVDHSKRIARQLCGYRCLPFDRRYRETRDDRPKGAVTLPYIQSVISDAYGD